jgi:hypothetical protein
VAQPGERADPRRERRWLAVEVGIATARRRLAFPPGTAPLGWEVTEPAAPRLRIEAFPLRAARGHAGGLALFGDATWQPTFDLPAAGGRTHPATALRSRAGILWRVRPARRVAVAPALAWARERFTVGKSGGLPVPGLADTRLDGVAASLALELSLSRRVALVGAAGAAWWAAAGDLAGDPRFFPGGRAFGLDGEAGLAVALGAVLSARALASWSETRWSLEADPSGAYSVRSARAEVRAGRVALRAEW